VSREAVADSAWQGLHRPLSVSPAVAAASEGGARPHLDPRGWLERRISVSGAVCLCGLCVCRGSARERILWTKSGSFHGWRTDATERNRGDGSMLRVSYVVGTCRQVEPDRHDRCRGRRSPCRRWKFGRL